MIPSRILSALTVAAAVAAATGASGCARKVCDDAEPVLAVFDSGGHRELALRPTADARLALCDAANLHIGDLTDDKERVVLRDLAGTEQASMRRGPDPGDSLLARSSGALRLHEDNGLIRVLDSQGVPLAQLGIDPAGGRALVYSPGGSPIAFADRAGDRRAIHSADGAVTHLVTGVAHDRAAAAFAVDALSIGERAVVARWLDRP